MDGRARARRGDEEKGQVAPFDPDVHETNKFKDWLDHPFSELTGAKLIELQQIKDQAANGTNPANDKGAPGISFRRRRWRTGHAR